VEEADAHQVVGPSEGRFHHQAGGKKPIEAPDRPVPRMPVLSEDLQRVRHFLLGREDQAPAGSVRGRIRIAGPIRIGRGDPVLAGPAPKGRRKPELGDIFEVTIGKTIEVGFLLASLGVGKTGGYVPAARIECCHGAKSAVAVDPVYPPIDWTSSR